MADPQFQSSSYVAPGGSWSAPYGPRYASFGRRLAAYLLDWVAVWVLAAVVTGATGHHEPWTYFATHVVNGKRVLVPVGTKLQFFESSAAVVFFFYGLGFLASSWRATPGMRALSVRLASQDGGALGIGRVVLRSVTAEIFGTLSALAALLSLVPLADMLWPLWDSRRQTLHDKVAGSVVLHDPGPPR